MLSKLLGYFQSAKTKQRNFALASLQWFASICRDSQTPAELANPKQELALQFYLLGAVDFMCQNLKYDPSEFIALAKGLFAKQGVTPATVSVLMLAFLKLPYLPEVAQTVTNGGRSFRNLLAGDPLVMLSVPQEIKEAAGQRGFPPSIGHLYVKLQEST